MFIRLPKVPQVFIRLDTGRIPATGIVLDSTAIKFFMDERSILIECSESEFKALGGHYYRKGQFYMTPTEGSLEGKFLQTKPKTVYPIDIPTQDSANKDDEPDRYEVIATDSKGCRLAIGDSVYTLDGAKAEVTNILAKNGKVIVACTNSAELEAEKVTLQ